MNLPTGKRESNPALSLSRRMPYPLGQRGGNSKKEVTEYIHAKREGRKERSDPEADRQTDRQTETQTENYFFLSFQCCRRGRRHETSERGQCLHPAVTASHGLVGKVVKASASRAEDPWF